MTAATGTTPVEDRTTAPTTRHTRRRRARRTAATTTALSVLLTGAAVVGGASGATAGTNCGTSVNGWDVYATVRSTTYNGHTVRLVNGRAYDESYAVLDSWASGEQTWVDRRRPGGSYTTCGPFTRSYSNEQDNIGYEMRACARYQFSPVPNVVVWASHCTGWYYDAD